MIMTFGVGILEILLVLGMSAVTGLFVLLRHPGRRWAIVGLASLIVATLCTPADPASTLLIGALLSLFFTTGSRFGQEMRIISCGSTQCGSTESP